MYNIEKMVKIFNKALEKRKAAFHEPRGNRKTGNIPAWNLMPIVTCSAKACKTCGVNGCYAVKNCLCHGYNLKTNYCFKAWAENTILAKTDLARLEWELEKYFNKKRRKPIRFFRIHASGDFFSREYANMWWRIAMRHYDINFLAFTKQWDNVRGIPFNEMENFSLVLSGWDGTDIPEDLKAIYRVAECVEDGCEPPQDYLECPGNCETCSACWFLKKINRNVFFHKH